ncbi:MAG: 4-amino-4-deoxy-L-arabinose transferase, partial [Thermoleophilia bacterium]|nr:4-amino-4-deoxy-L-arabinose transferase [Thermoleophilia bacterium]
MARLRPRSPIWGVERPALETWSAILAFAPVVGWLGCPPWWRETFPRLAHYYQINTDRRGSLPDIQVFYLGQTYEYSLPWHNAWVLIGVTVPLAILVAALLGIAWSVRGARRDPLPLFFLVQLATLPVFRMLPTPAHDGVRLFLPTFFFLAAMAGWGAALIARAIQKRLPEHRGWIAGIVATGLVLLPSAWQLIRVHPYGLSYYNELIGGPRGAWSRGLFELTYWYDAFNPRVLAEINERLPKGAQVDILNDKTNTSMPVFMENQALGDLRADIRLGWRDTGQFPYVWLLTQDSKASAFTRLLFAIRPWYASRPAQLDGLRVATVADPPAVATAWTLWLLTDAPDDQPPERPDVPAWVRNTAPALGRFWGEGLTKVARLGAYEPTFEWARSDPEGLKAAARGLVERKGDAGDDPGRRRLRAILNRYPSDSPGRFADVLFRAGPNGLLDAARLLADDPEAVRRVVTRYPYTEPVAPGRLVFELTEATPPSAAAAGRGLAGASQVVADVA